VGPSLFGQLTAESPQTTQAGVALGQVGSYGTPQGPSRLYVVVPWSATVTFQLNQAVLSYGCLPAILILFIDFIFAFIFLFLIPYFVSFNFITCPVEPSSNAPQSRLNKKLIMKAPLFFNSLVHIDRKT